MNALKLFPGTDMLVELLGLKTQSSGAEKNDAAVNMTLYNSANQLVSGQAWPTPLNSLGDGGNYQGFITDSVDLIVNQQYRLQIVADGGQNQHRVWDLTCIAVRDDDDN